MIQQEMLTYQQLDGELIRIERDLRKKDSFIKRRQYKAAMQECEETFSKLDARAVELKNQLTQVQQSVKNITDVIEEHSREIDSLEDEDELNYMNKKLNEQLAELSNAEKEIKRILREGEEVSKAFEETNAKLPRLAAGYTRCNEEFNREAAEIKPRVNEIRTRQAELRKSIDDKIFNIYSKVAAGGLSPVFVPLEDGTRCGGCRMEMPKAQVEAQFAGKTYMRCEHCGRIIFKNE